MKAAYLLKLIAQVSLLYCFCLITSYFIRSPVKELCHLLAFYFEKGIELSGGGGGGGTQGSLIREGSAPMSKLLPFYISFGRIGNPYAFQREW